MQEVELRAARDREIQTRERRRSFYGDAPPPGYGAPGSAPYGAFAHSPSGHSSADLDRKFGELDIERDVKYSSRQRTYSTSGGDRTSPYGAPPGNVYSSPGQTYQSTASGFPVAGAPPYNRAASPFRSPYTSTSPNPRPQEVSSYPGGPDPIARAASPYGRPEPIARAASPFSRPEPIPRAASPYGRPPPIEPIARAASPYGQSRPPYSARAPSPIPPSRGPPLQRSTSPFPQARAPSPYLPPRVGSVYSPGHGLEGQPRSRAPSPMPGPPGVSFPSSPRMPSIPPSGDHQQLSAPEAFSRPANAAQSYTPFNIMKIQDMEQFYDQIPRMPLVLETHDVYHQDWIRFMNVRISVYQRHGTDRSTEPSPGSRAGMGWKHADSRIFSWAAAQAFHPHRRSDRSLELELFPHSPGRSRLVQGSRAPLGRQRWCRRLQLAWFTPRHF